MEGKLCSVIIPMYNCAKTAQQSIQSAQNQSYDNIEILAIDNNSTDHTLEIVKAAAEKDMRIRLIHNEKNLGVAASRNIGFEHAKGEYVALLDGDDLWEPNKLEKQIALLESSGCDFCYTSYSLINESGSMVGAPHIVPGTCAYPDLLKENFICCSTVLLRSKLTKNHKMSKEFFLEDFVYWLKLLESGYSAIGCNQVLLKHRVSQYGRTYNKISTAKYRWQVYRKFCRLNLMKSIYYFSFYTFHGILKYHKITNDLKNKAG